MTEAQTETKPIAGDDVLEVARRCAAVLGFRPAGLLTDIDGTVSLIAPTPEAASVSDKAKGALARLAERLDVAGVVTGRAARNAEEMVSVPGLLYIGNHGLESRIRGVTRVNPSAALESGAVTSALREVEIAASAAGLGDGILFEDKGVTASVHYRLAHDQEAARATLLPLAAAAAKNRGLKVTEGRMVIELRPAVPVNKGTAIASVIELYDLESLVFLGDDVTDIDGFRALATVRDAGQIKGLNVAVLAPESSPAVARAADVIVHGVECCVDLLCALATLLERGGETSG